VLPDAVRQALAPPEAREQLLEVVLDLGRAPEARYPGRAVSLGEAVVERADLAAVVEQLGAFGGDNRAGIERTLHRISAIRNRTGTIVGLTCRVGRAVFGTVAMVRDLMDSGQSLRTAGDQPRCVIDAVAKRGAPVRLRERCGRVQGLPFGGDVP
jgi:stage III sporulation protein SpoIIIAA